MQNSAIAVNHEKRTRSEDNRKIENLYLQYTRLSDKEKLKFQELMQKYQNIQPIEQKKRQHIEDEWEIDTPWQETERESLNGKANIILSIDKTIGSIISVTTDDERGNSISNSESAGSEGISPTLEVIKYLGGDHRKGFSGLGIGINYNAVEKLNPINIYMVFRGMMPLKPYDINNENYFVINTGIGYGHINQTLSDENLTSHLSGILYYKLDLGFDFHGLNLYVGYRFNIAGMENKYRSYFSNYDYSATLMYHYFVLGVGCRM
jgi:hypothetical protein